MRHDAALGPIAPHAGLQHSDAAGAVRQAPPPLEDFMTALTPASREPWRVPLHLLAAAGVAILLIVIVGALAAQTYRGVQEILRQTAFDETRYIRDALGEKVQGILE